jgi:RND superfamily putative drug exporter
MARPGRGTKRERRLLAPVARLTIGHPRLVVAVWLVAMLGLALVGKGLEDEVSTRPIYIDGSAAQRAHEIAVHEFGGEDALIVMLKGPAPALDRQGPELVERLQAIPRTLVISPWSSSGSIEGLRPSPGVAAVLFSVGRPATGVGPDTLPTVRRVVEETLSGPVHASIGGGPAIIDSLLDSAVRAATFGELLALPVLLIVLLFVCRSFLAAAMPVVVGGIVVGATRGIMDLVAGSVTIDSFAIGTAGMLGLALGVDYSLLIVARFRQEMEAHGDVERAVETTVVSTGRSILPAGFGLVLAMLASLALLPAALIGSVAVAVIAATVLSMVSAILLSPAALALLGTRLDRWSLPRRHESGGLVLAWSRRLSRRPGVVLGLIFLLVLSGAWAFTLQTSTGAASLLPPDDPGRLAQEDIEGKLGPGWAAPFEVVMSGGEKPVTTPRRLHALAAFQRQVERDPGVEAMAGFATLERSTRALGSAERRLTSQERGSARLERGLVRSEKGAAASGDGLARGADGASQLTVALGEVGKGSGRLASGLDSSAEGSANLSSGLGRADTGGDRLSDGAARSSDGADQLAEKVAEARKQSAEAAGSAKTLESALQEGESALDAAPLQATADQLSGAWEALQRMTSGRSDPEYGATAAAIRAASQELNGSDPGTEEPAADVGVAGGVQQALDQFSLALYLADRQNQSSAKARDGIARLAKASAKLDRGLSRLADRSQDLSAALERLSNGGERLSPGLRQLASGAERLVGGLGNVEDGAGGLASGLAGGAQQSQRLTGGLGKLRAGVAKQNGPGTKRLQQQSPGLFRSGYFYLAGLDGSHPEQRNQASFLVNLSQGGSAARMLVMPNDPPATAGVNATADRIDADAAELAEKTGGEVVVGGLPPSLDDLNSVLRDKAPLLRIALSLITLVILLPVTRSLALAILAALLNLLTVSATFGLLALLFNGSLLGGPGFVDTMAIPAVVILTFGLAIDYEVFIFARIREEYMRSGSTTAAIDNGFGQIAHVISGAAMIMIAVFLAFSVSSLANLRNLGVALAIGVFIDAFVIRFVILPATMRALGDRSWWLPKWLDRILPGQSRLPAEIAA